MTCGHDDSTINIVVGIIIIIIIPSSAEVNMGFALSLELTPVIAS